MVTHTRSHMLPLTYADALTVTHMLPHTDVPTCSLRTHAHLCMHVHTKAHPWSQPHTCTLTSAQPQFLIAILTASQGSLILTHPHAHMLLFSQLYPLISSYSRTVAYSCTIVCTQLFTHTHTHTLILRALGALLPWCGWLGQACTPSPISMKTQLDHQLQVRAGAPQGPDAGVARTTRQRRPQAAGAIPSRAVGPTCCDKCPFKREAGVSFCSPPNTLILDSCVQERET